MSKLLLTLGGVVVLLALVTVFTSARKEPAKYSDSLTATQPSSSPVGGSLSSALPTANNGGGGNLPSSLAACPASTSEPIFSVLPMQLEDFTAFRPLGFVTLPIHIFGAKHSNFVINQIGESKKGLTVRFPSQAIVTQITSTKSASSEGYQVVFYPCQQFKSYFFHLGTLSSALQAAFEQGKPVCQEFQFSRAEKITKCELKTEISIKAGDVVGTNDGAAGVDWGGIDYRLTHTFANPKRYDFDYLHYVSPVDYLTPPLKTSMMDKLGSYDGKVKRTAEPRTGSIAQDIPGTAQGNWFIGDNSFTNTQDLSIFLALLHDYVNPSEPHIVMGTSVKNVEKGVYGFTPRDSGTINRDFKDIKPDGQIYCFENFKSGQSTGKIPLSQVSGSILMRLPDEKTLSVGYHSGSCQSVTEMAKEATLFSR